MIIGLVEAKAKNTTFSMKNLNPGKKLLPYFLYFTLHAAPNAQYLVPGT
jgi:hypothetical protein